MSYRLPRYRVALVREGCSHSNMKHIHDPEDVHRIIDAEYADAVVEMAMMLALDTKNKVIGIFEISRGSLNASIIHPRDVFQRAILVNAASVILVHNHPSGDPTPSTEDVALTKKLVEAGRVMDITVLDHVICGEGKYASLRERGEI